MRAFVKNHKRTTSLVGLFVLLVALLAAWEYTAPTRGRLSAHFDVWRGHYTVLAYGLPSPWRPEYTRLLRERYGIEVHTVALCIVSETLVSYANSYNEVSVTASNRKFGRDVFKECAETASKNWERQRTLNVTRN
jgi:hypothetical protein